MLRMLTREAFERRTANGARTPVYREFLADRETPVSVLSRVADGKEDVFLLESVYNGDRKGRYSYLGLGGGVANPSAPFAAADELPSFQGGRVGYFSYEAVSDFEPRVPRRHEEGTPSEAFMEVDAFAVFDSVRSTVTIAKVAGPGGYDEAMAEIDALNERLLSAESIERCVSRRAGGKGGRLTEFRPEMTEAEFCGMVEKCKEAIRAGEVVQIVPSQKFTAETDIPALAFYRALRLVNPSPYNFFLRVGAKTLIGSSPEELVRLEGGVASIAPIAGTRRRGATALEDADLEAELVADPKERAEHMMLVDLARNDLGRVCRTGSVRVEGLAHVERYSHVMHLVSNVFGELDPAKADAAGLFRSAFPAGTLTGAPKIRAMELLAEIEKSPRGVYGGAAGYFSNTGDMDFAIVIRTMVLEGGTLTMRAGAGIVADSVPESEYRETLGKSAAIFAAAKFAKEIV